MNKIIKVVQTSTSPFNVTWVLNNICTNACSYCPTDLHKGKNHHYEWANAQKFIDILFKRFHKVHCSIAGGEPSVSPFFKDLVKMFYENGGTVGVTSNAAKSADFWNEVAVYLNYICFSWHAEFPDEKFKDKVVAASEHTNVTVRVMMHPDHWDRSVEAFLTYSNLDYIECEAVRILDWMHDLNGVHSRYTGEQDAWFKNSLNNISDRKKIQKYYSNVRPFDFRSEFHFDNGEIITSGTPVDFINKGLTNFYGYKCEIGQREIFVDWRGYVRPGNCDVGGWIGNLNDPENIRWPNESFICNKKICHCATDVLINKEL